MESGAAFVTFAFAAYFYLTSGILRSAAWIGIHRVDRAMGAITRLSGPSMSADCSLHARQSSGGAAFEMQSPLANAMRISPFSPFGSEHWP